MVDKLTVALFIAAAFVSCACMAAEDGDRESREAAEQLLKDGNYREAADMLSRIALDTARTPREAAESLELAIECLTTRLSNPAEAEALRGKAIDAWPRSWRILAIAAPTFWSDNRVLPIGIRVGVGRRVGHPRTRGPDEERRRVVALRLLLRAIEHGDDAADPATADEKAALYARMGDVVRVGRSDRQAWRFTSLTDLDTLPEVENENVFWSRPQRGAPADAAGNPIYYPVPASWEAAENDGQRWRWTLDRMAALSPAGRAEADIRFGEFLTSQFGVQTMVADSPLGQDAELAGETGPFAMRTLKESETIARVGGALKRFAMPDEYNHIAALRRAADADDSAIRSRALTMLAGIFENRQQFDAAVGYWKKARNVAGESSSLAESAIKRITGNNGMIERGPVAPAGQTTALSYLFRNGDKVRFTARRLDEAKLLLDIRDMLKSGSDAVPGEYFYQRPEMIGRLVVEKNEEKYIAETAAEWSVDLEPLPGHSSRRISVDLPFNQAGCYLIEAKMRDGNASRVVLWLADLALVRKDLGDRTLFFVADAVTGRPETGADVSFLGFSSTYNHRNNKQRITLREIAERTDDNGFALLQLSNEKASRTWLAVARTADNRMAYIGFDPIWRAEAREEREMEVSRAFLITDRPVYRPGQEVHFKAWIGQATYAPRPEKVANVSLKLVINNPRGEAVYEKTLVTDEFGGVADSFTSPTDATLGGYFLRIDESKYYDGIGFRVEEYKNPEFEVTVETPDAALELGDSAQVKVRAAYYYGAPVANAKVTYKVLRTPHDQSWSPPWRWEWLYGPGAWIRNYDYSWYPGFSGWGRIGPTPSWLPFRPMQQPEVVAEGEGEIDPDGVFRFTLDTRPAKELFGHQDHAYAISVEVTDQSRRTITGGGKVVAARQPFTVALWTDRGWYTANQRLQTTIRAMLPLGQGLETKGTLTLYRVTYDSQGVPSESEAGSWPITTDKDGNADMTLNSGEAGQYRLACSLADANGRKVEGTTLVTVRGAAGDADYRFSALELVPEQREYGPDATVRLAVNTENKDATVLLFPRVERNASALPEVLRVSNGTAEFPITVSRGDIPNFYCHAVTVWQGKVYSEVREIFVPPADKSLTVEVEADKSEYLPGGKAAFSVRVTDANGEPVSGQSVVSLYDRSVEYISGGSNVPDIRSHFWSWKRHYNPHLVSSLNKSPYPVEKQGDVSWEPIGIFGSQEADWNDAAVYTNGKQYGGRQRGGVMRKQSLGVRSAPANFAAVDGVAMEMDAASLLMAAAPAMMEMAQDADDMTGGAGDAGAAAEPAIRSNFADTALWVAALEMDADGKATFTADMPESLTSWKARVWTRGMQIAVGQGETLVTTKKNLIVRPQTPRFLTQKDQVILSANLHNYLPRGKTARAQLVLEGGLLEPASGVELEQTVELPANGEKRLDWLVVARRPGEAKVVMKLLTDEESDAAEMTVPVVVHGSRRVENFGGMLGREEQERSIGFRVPEERLPEQSVLQFSFSPTIAGAMLEALPYLIEYPYGCTEQTLNRFLPLVTTRGFLDSLGVSLADAKRMLEQARTDAQSEAWRARHGDPRAGLARLPVFDDKELEAMVAGGVERLASMQCSDGGWGWFSGFAERSYPHTTAVVVNGLAAARANGRAIPMGVFENGISWLERYQSEQVARLQTKLDDAGKKVSESDPDPKRQADNVDAFVYLVLSANGKPDAAMRGFLYRDRLKLSLTGLSMLGLSLHGEKADDELAMVVRNLSQFLQTNADNGTAWLGTPSTGWWWWFNDAIETQAWYLKLLSRVDPKSTAASGVARYLLANRKNGTYWRSTRDTAYAIEALAEYAVASGEAAPDMTVALYFDGSKVLERKLDRTTLLADNRFILEGLAVEPGEHQIRLVRSGEGTVYFTGSLSVFSLEDPIAAAGGDLKVARQYYKLTAADRQVDMQSASGAAVKGRVDAYDRTEIPGPFASGAPAVALASGDLVEVELTIKAANDYEYLVFEDMKAAGLEAVELRSGYGSDSMGAYIEYRDQKVTLFVRSLRQGEHTIRYRFRAEIPGSFSALPVFGGGMYATELFCNSDEMKVKIVETGVYEEDF